MLSEMKKLEKNKAKVEEFLKEKKYSFVEPVSMECGMEFLEYMKSEGIADDLANAKYTKEREFIDNHEAFPMIYMMNIITGMGSARKMKTILKDEAAMKLVGFTSEQIREGVTKRPGNNQHGKGYERKSGVMASATLIDNLACFELQSMEKCFNKFIKRIACSGKVELGDVYILDSSIVETGENYPGAKPLRKVNEEGELTSEIVWGFKVFILMSAKTKIPIAIYITTANDADSPMLKKMVEKGIENIGKEKIKYVLADRGFIDGTQLYEVKYDMGIDFVIPVRKNMDIWTCMVGLREENKNNIVEWKYGKKGMSGGYLSKGSVSYAQYAAQAAGSKKHNNGAPLDAVVVTRWAGKEIAPGNEKVIITSADAQSATELIELYGQRSLIENCNFRELKQAAMLTALPQYKNENAEATAYMHMLLCIFTLAIFNALVETIYADDPDVAKQIPKNIREFRFMKECEKAKLFVMAENYYYVYDMSEFMALIGFTLM